ncbi:uncharacterized protein BKA78DRAFT_382877 [Phyllosticta capitalensis]|uniref:uncharacterized protein n=1 Tax=Phyllosticta capitalensis TaxID=121624 RepID=UPI00312E176B
MGWLVPEHIHPRSSRECGMAAYVRGAFEYFDCVECLFERRRVLFGGASRKSRLPLPASCYCRPPTYRRSPQPFTVHNLSQSASKPRTENFHPSLRLRTAKESPCLTSRATRTTIKISQGSKEATCALMSKLLRKLLQSSLASAPRESPWSPGSTWPPNRLQSSTASAARESPWIPSVIWPASAPRESPWSPSSTWPAPRLRPPSVMKEGLSVKMS